MRAVGRRRVAVDRRRRGQVARLAARRPSASWPTSPRCRMFADEVKRRRFSDVVLLGMGGSSLGPEVLAETFGPQPGSRSCTCSTRTDPAQITAVEREIDLGKTLFIVSTKSGIDAGARTSSCDYFFDRVAAVRGRTRPASTSSPSPIPARRWRRCAERGWLSPTSSTADPAIGGRYSVLSDFGMVPAAAMGLDVQAPPRDGAHDGALLRRRRAAGGEPRRAARRDHRRRAPRAGRDKVTIIASPGIAALGAWLEQLLAEITGKHGKGIVPVDRRAARRTPGVYGRDRLFVHIWLDGARRSGAATRRCGRWRRPAIRWCASALTDRWHDRPGVLPLGDRDRGRRRDHRHRSRSTSPTSRRSKIEDARADRRLREIGVAAGPRAGVPPRTASPSSPTRATPSELGGAPDAVAAICAAASAARSGAKAGDYVALLAYIERNDDHERGPDGDAHARSATHRTRRDLRRLRAALPALDRAGLQGRAEQRRVPADHLRRPADDLTVPGQGYSFGIVKAAQARGDFDVLAERGRRALRVHLQGRRRRAGGAGADAMQARRSDNWPVLAKERDGCRSAMVGLGRMGGNIVAPPDARRPSTASSTTATPSRVEALARRRRDGRRLAGGPGQAADGAARRLGDAARRRDHRGDGDASWASLLEPGDIIIDGGNTFYKDDIRRAKALAEQGHPLCRRRHLRRRLGAGARLLHDDRRRRRRRSTGSIRSSRRWRRASATSRARPAARRARSARRAGLYPCRARRRRAISSRWSITASNTA